MLLKLIDYEFLLGLQELILRRNLKHVTGKIMIGAAYVDHWILTQWFKG